MRKVITSPMLSERLLAGGDDEKETTMMPDHTVIVEEETVMMDEALLGRQQSDSIHPQATITSIVPGQPQPGGFRDAFAGILFLLHAGAILYLAMAWGIPALSGFDVPNNQGGGGGSTPAGVELHLGGLFALCLCSTLAAFVMAAVALHLMMQYAAFVVQFSLGFTVICNIFMAIYFLIEDSLLGFILCLVMALSGACYAYAVWWRIPFSASNLQTALAAVQANRGIILVAYLMCVLLQIWSAIWVLAWIGVYARNVDCRGSSGAQQPQDCVDHTNGWVTLCFLLSYYWTAEVGKNLIHVTVAGVVGTFVFAPHEANHFCSPAVYDSLARASTWSFGSICLGSLLTAILQLLYQLVLNARRRRRGPSVLMCIAECLVGFLERLVQYFNKFAYCYIGLYGYDYLSAGKNVMHLFIAKGWTTLITDSLVLRALSFMSVAIGLITGAFGVLLATIKPAWVADFGSMGTFSAFMFPFIIGTALAMIQMSVVASSVDTVIVAFAEAPLQLEQNHPILFRQMVAAWTLVYPNEFTM